MEPVRKFEIGDMVKDTYNNYKVCTITAHYLDLESQQPEWRYSFDSLGWYFVPESDLIKFEGE